MAEFWNEIQFIFYIFLVWGFWQRRKWLKNYFVTWWDNMKIAWNQPAVTLGKEEESKKEKK